VVVSQVCYIGIKDGNFNWNTWEKKGTDILKHAGYGKDKD
jgi:hypothetical protein